MAKDKIIGALILFLGIVIIFLYTVIGPIDLACEGIWKDTAIDGLTAWRDFGIGLDWHWAVVMPLWLIICVVGVIAAWIGFSMVTSPAPVPLEELEAELEKEEAGSA